MEMSEVVERLAAIAAAMDVAAAKHGEIHAAAEATLERIVATVETREAELEQKLTDAEAKIAALEASMAERGCRKTEVILQAKDGEAASLDSALVGLSVEQRFAVKAGLLRAGLV